MTLTIWLAAAMVQLAAIPANLLVPGKPVGEANAGVQGYYVLAKMYSPGVFRIGKLSLSWSQAGSSKERRDDLSVNLEGFIYSGSVSCPSAGTLLQLDMTEGKANVGTSSIGVGAGATAVRVDWDCRQPGELLSDYALRAWFDYDFGLPVSYALKVRPYSPRTPSPYISTEGE